MNERRALRRRPPREPGPRLLPVLLALIMAGVAIGAGGKLLFHFFHHLAGPVHPLATPTPNSTVLSVQPTRLPPIPTPKGTWFHALATEPYLTSVSPSSRATPVHVFSQMTPMPRKHLPPVPVPYTPMPRKRIPPVPVPRAPAPHTPLPRTPRSWSEAVPEASIPLPILRSTVGEGVPVRVARPPLSGPSRVVRRYLSALIHGDETTAYRLLGALPGDHHVALTEESFINTSARIFALSSAPEGAGAVVRAEIETAGGLYFATYHLHRQSGRYLIVSHEFIKL